MDGGVRLGFWELTDFFKSFLGHVKERNEFVRYKFTTPRSIRLIPICDDSRVWASKLIPSASVAGAAATSAATTTTAAAAASGGGGQQQIMGIHQHFFLSSSEWRHSRIRGEHFQGRLQIRWWSLECWSPRHQRFQKQLVLYKAFFCDNVLTFRKYKIIRPKHMILISLNSAWSSQPLTH